MWIDEEIIEFCYQRDQLWKRRRKEAENIMLKVEFRIMLNKVTAKIKLAKNNYYTENINRCWGNCRKTWNIFNELTGTPPKGTIDDTLKKNFSIEDDSVWMCDQFNNAFSNEIKKLRDGHDDPKSRL